MSAEVEQPNIKSSGKGPHGLGDPEDKRLRKVELNVLIKDKVRQAAKEKCKDYVKIFQECAKKNGLLTPFNCTAENNAQIDCIKTWFENEDLNKQMREEYLEERTYYRATGVPKKKAERRLGT